MSAIMLERPAAIGAVDVALAWTDPEYRAGLSAEELAQLPPSPVGTLDGIATDDIVAGSLEVSILSPAGCWFTLACTGTCCAG